MQITPVILGRGGAGHAIAKSLACLGELQPELGITPPVWVERGASLTQVKGAHPNPVLCIANPHALHTPALLAAQEAGFAGALCEKPACVNPSQAEALRSLTMPVAVMHVYRQSWGIQTLKRMLLEGHFGRVFAIEGRYWQASAAERALQMTKVGGKSSIATWKDDPALSGEYDAYLDIGSHWIDAVSYLTGSLPTRFRGWRSYVNAPSPHRDSHIQVQLQFAGGERALGSISKHVHGATNLFEIHVMGEKLGAHWNFLSPDEILCGEGAERRIIVRKDRTLGSRQAAFHGLGWLEGYIEIAAAFFQQTFLVHSRSPTTAASSYGGAGYPTLTENIALLEKMFNAEWDD